MLSGSAGISSACMIYMLSDSMNLKTQVVAVQIIDQAKLNLEIAKPELITTCTQIHMQTKECEYTLEWKAGKNEV